MPTIQAGLVLAILLAACVPESRHPLSNPGSAVVDQRLTGVWKTKIDDETVIAHFLEKSDGEMRIVAVAHKDGGGGGWTTYSMFVSRLGDEWYMNVKFVGENGKPNEIEDPPYHLVRYRISEDGKLTIWTMAKPAVIAAIESGLAGKVKKGKWFNETLITAPTDELAAFVRSSDPQRLFANPLGPFRRQM